MTAQNLSEICACTLWFNYRTYRSVSARCSQTRKKTILHRKKDGSCTFYHYHANLTRLIKYKESHIFGMFDPVLKTVCVPSLKVLGLFYAFRALRIMGKCTSRHLFSFGGLCYSARLRPEKASKATNFAEFLNYRLL